MRDLTVRLESTLVSEEWLTAAKTAIGNMEQIGRTGSRSLKHSLQADLNRAYDVFYEAFVRLNARCTKRLEDHIAERIDVIALTEKNYDGLTAHVMSTASIKLDNSDQNLVRQLESEVGQPLLAVFDSPFMAADGRVNMWKAMLKAIEDNEQVYGVWCGLIVAWEQDLHMTRAIHRASSTLNDLHEFKMDQFRSLLNDTLMPHVRVEYEEALANAQRVFEEQLLSSSCECLHGATKVFLPAILDNKEALLSVMATKHDDDAFSNLKELAMAGKHMEVLTLAQAKILLDKARKAVAVLAFTMISLPPCMERDDDGKVDFNIPDDCFNAVHNAWKVLDSFETFVNTAAPEVTYFLCLT